MSQLFLANFTAANGTLLTAYTPDIGSIGANLQGTFEIESAAAQPLTAADGDLFAWDAGVADVVIDCLVTGFANAGSGWAVNANLHFRTTDVNNNWKWYWEWDATGGNFSLLQCISGTTTAVASTTVNGVSGTQYAVRIVCKGPIIIISINGVPYITYASATFNQSATKFGLYYGTYGSAGGTALWNGLQVNPALSLGFDTIAPDRMKRTQTTEGVVHLPIVSNPTAKNNYYELVAPSPLVAQRCRTQIGWVDVPFLQAVPQPAPVNLNPLATGRYRR
jgi:hypothetical protein